MANVESFSNPNWHQPTPHLSRKIFRTVLIDLAILGMLLAAGEWGLRTFHPQTARHIFSTQVTGGHPIRYNAHRLREIEFPAAKPQGEQRILCLGDSTTFGAGLAAEATYPKQLQQLLNRSGMDPGWFVINAGGQGASVSGLIHYLQEEGLAFEPNAVILGFSPTMLSVAGQSGDAGPAAVKPKPPVSFWKEAARFLHRKALGLHIQLHQSYLYVTLDNQLRKRLYRLGVLRDRMDRSTGAILAYAFDDPAVALTEAENAYQTLNRELDQLHGLLQARGINLVVLGIPSRFRISSHPADNERGYTLDRIRIEPLDRLGESCAKLAIPFVDLTPRLKTERMQMLKREKTWNDLYIPSDYAHLNAAGMRIAAEEIRQTFETTRLSSPAASSHQAD